MNKEQYKKILEGKRVRALRVIEAREQSQRASLIQYESATLDGYRDVIIADPEIELSDYDELTAVIDSVDRDIWAMNIIEAIEKYMKLDHEENAK